MKKLLFIASEYASGMIPFATTIINTLSKDRSFEVHCICVNSRKSSYKGLIAKEAHPVFVDYPEGKIKKFIYKVWPFGIINRIRMACDELNPDVIHFLTGDFTLATYILLHVDERFYYTVHDLHPHEVNFQRIKDWIMHTMITTGCKICRDEIKHLTTSSKTQLNELKNIYEGRHIEYTCFPSLINEDIIKGGVNVPELIGIDKYVLFWGNVNKYKGVELLIEAFSKIDAKNGIKLVIAGRGSKADYTNNHDVICIDRFIDDREIRNLFEKSLFVVYPYLSVTMSGVLSIAYFFKKRMLLSDIPFFMDYASEDTTYFEKGNVNDLKKCLEEMIRMPPNRATQSFYEQFYSEQALIDSYKKLYL